MYQYANGFQFEAVYWGVLQWRHGVKFELLIQRTPSISYNGQFSTTNWTFHKSSNPHSFQRDIKNVVLHNRNVFTPHIMFSLIQENTNFTYLVKSLCFKLYPYRLGATRCIVSNATMHKTNAGTRFGKIIQSRRAFLLV